MTPRIYLTGSVAIEHGAQLVREKGFRGRQGRIAFAFLAVHRHRSISRDELLSAIWPDDAATQTDASLDAILSKPARLPELLGALAKATGQVPRNPMGVLAN